MGLRLSAHFRIEMISTKVGMNTQIGLQCASIRGKAHPGDRCLSRSITGTEWCGKHKTTQVRFVAITSLGTALAGQEIEHVLACRSPRSPLIRSPISDMPRSLATDKIRSAILRWVARRAGPLLWYREESNNHVDFFSSDPVTEIPLKEFVSFVDAGKGYVMDIKSAVSLIDHATKNNEEVLNPFNRAILPALFLKRVKRHVKKQWANLVPMTDAQKLALATTDVFRMIEDLGYYTDPSWFMDLDRRGLQRFYMELADIWFHRAALTQHDRMRIAPGRSPFSVPVSTALIMQQRALQPLLLNTCRLLVSASSSRSDRQLGVMFVLGSLSLVSERTGYAYPWLVDQFSPGVTRIIGNEIVALHPSVLGY